MKIFTLDFETLNQKEKSDLFLGLGVILIGVALIYPRLHRLAKLKYLESKEYNANETSKNLNED